MNSGLTPLAQKKLGRVKLRKKPYKSPHVQTEAGSGEDIGEGVVGGASTGTVEDTGSIENSAEIPLAAESEGEVKNIITRSKNVFNASGTLSGFNANLVASSGKR